MPLLLELHCPPTARVRLPPREVSLTRVTPLQPTTSRAAWARSASALMISLGAADFEMGASPAGRDPLRMSFCTEEETRSRLLRSTDNGRMLRIVGAPIELAEEKSNSSSRSIVATASSARTTPAPSRRKGECKLRTASGSSMSGIA